MKTTFFFLKAPRREIPGQLLLHLEQEGSAVVGNRPEDLPSFALELYRAAIRYGGTFSNYPQSKEAYFIVSNSSALVYNSLLEVASCVRNPHPQCSRQSKLYCPVNHFPFTRKRCIFVHKRRCCRSSLSKGRHQSLFTRR